MVNDIIFMKDNVMNSTYANIGKSHTVSLDLNGDWNIIPDLRWSVYVSTSYTHMMANSDMLKAKRCGWQFYGNTNINYKLPCKVRLSAYGDSIRRGLTCRAEAVRTDIITESVPVVPS